MNNQTISIYGMMAIAMLIVNAIVLETTLVKNQNWYTAFFITLPLLGIAIYFHLRACRLQKSGQNYFVEDGITSSKNEKAA